MLTRDLSVVANLLVYILHWLRMSNQLVMDKLSIEPNLSWVHSSVVRCPRDSVTGNTMSLRCCSSPSISLTFSLFSPVSHERSNAHVSKLWTCLPCTLLLKVKVKVKIHRHDIVPLRSESPPQKRSGMARVLKVFQFYLHTHTVHPQSEWAIPAFAFPATAGTQFTDPRGMEGWVDLGAK